MRWLIGSGSLFFSSYNRYSYGLKVKLKCPYKNLFFENTEIVHTTYLQNKSLAREILIEISYLCIHYNIVYNLRVVNDS